MRLTNGGLFMNLRISTDNNRQVLDITDEIEQLLPEKTGIAHVFVQHTTCALTTIDIDPGMENDLLAAVAELIPHKQWRHPHDNTYTHVSAHLLGSLIGPSLSVPFQDKRLLLGTWQRVILVELDGPRERKLIINTTSVDM
jgi:secondary thiamine-phosphate synthase enzyme